MERIGAKRQMRGDLEIEGLVISIEVARRQERIKQADLHIEMTMDGGVSL